MTQSGLIFTVLIIVTMVSIALIILSIAARVPPVGDVFLRGHY